MKKEPCPDCGSNPCQCLALQMEHWTKNLMTRMNDMIQPDFKDTRICKNCKMVGNDQSISQGLCIHCRDAGVTNLRDFGVLEF